MSISMGMDQAKRETMAEAVTKVLADTYALYFKTHAYHWNVTGPRFHDLHMLFETQYNEMWMATDVIAERVRALGVKAPMSYGEMDKHAEIRSEASKTDANEMISDLLAGHEQVAATIRGALRDAADNGDEATADVLTPRLTAHEKMAWMLRSTLG
ncbi:DNA starvation/stationary phase protection protein [Hyphobacterium sp. HN65]|uniref:DNA starvation/stationary phase protection protein n=1 Tax=Hyphobacterium lacteum TaxID=3116575 RepID=A0ABU7LS41_9PROT|nr:DNA starvation/stationary phase protection protein [Hyphobacterium sp. HN65]MEE2526404.1 DNA starvation/stationary phase protection protein [Hyphobacterium sp. HN65]